MAIGSKVKPQLWPLFAILLVSASCKVAIAQETVQAATPAKVVLAGPFRIHVHVEQQVLADRVREIGEQTWEAASRLYGSELPEEKLDVYLYRTVDDCCSE